MKLFSKKVKKKPLTDKAKEERKQKCKHIIKIILDILMYGFAILMAFALVIGGACSPKPKTASAYFHSDGGYTSITQVEANPSSSSTTLHYYYDYNYKKTFPKFANFFDSLPTSMGVGRVRLTNFIDVDNTTFKWLSYFYFTPTQEYRLGIRTDDDVAIQRNITFVTIKQNDIVIDRSDILTSIFNGRNAVYLSNEGGHTITDNDTNFYKFLSYYFGEYGYNRIEYTFPINVSNLSYLFAYSDNTDTTIENSYLFKNDTFPSQEWDGSLPYPHAIYHDEPVFSGSFRSNGTYYSGILFRFATIFGYVDHGEGFLRADYYFGGTSSINSENEFYYGYWYLDSIYFTGNGFSTNVWNACSRTYTIETGSGSNFYYYNFNNVSWVGDTPYSSTSYRDLFIYYSDDAFSGLIHHPFNDYFPLLNNMTFADFLNYIGDAYPTNSTGVPSEVSSPFTSVFAWLRGALSGIMPFFGYTIIPGITIGTLIMVPITMSIILFVVNLFKR